MDFPVETIQLGVFEWTSFIFHDLNHPMMNNDEHLSSSPLIQTVSNVDPLGPPQDAWSLVIQAEQAMPQPWSNAICTIAQSSP